MESVEKSIKSKSNQSKPGTDLERARKTKAKGQTSTSGTQTDKAPVYDSDGSSEVHNYENCYDNEIFNMFTQEEQYIELLKPIPEPHQVPQNDNNVISEDSSVEQSRGTVEQNPVNVEETRALYDSLYNNLAIEVEKVNKAIRVNWCRPMREGENDMWVWRQGHMGRSG
nr:hypothetical protein [Tanacetum cinerariifolium]